MIRLPFNYLLAPTDLSTHRIPSTSSLNFLQSWLWPSTFRKQSFSFPNTVGIKYMSGERKRILWFKIFKRFLYSMIILGSIDWQVENFLGRDGSQRKLMFTCIYNGAYICTLTVKCSYPFTSSLIFQAGINQTDL